MDLYLEQKSIYATKKSGNAIVTVLAIIGGVLLIAILWNAWTRNKCHDHGNSYANAKELGYLAAQTQNNCRDIDRLSAYERQDYGKIEYMEGNIYGKRPYVGYAPEHRGGCGGGNTQFREVRKFKEESDDVEVVTVCNQ